MKQTLLFLSTMTQPKEQKFRLVLFSSSHKPRGLLGLLAHGPAVWLHTTFRSTFPALRACYDAHRVTSF